jgi:hypothetical protein
MAGVSDRRGNGLLFRFNFLLGDMMNRRAWTNDEIITFARMFDNFSIKRISIKLKRSIYSVASLARRYRAGRLAKYLQGVIVPIKEQPAAWSEYELEYITRHYPSTKTSRMATKMGRTVCAIRNKSQGLGLRKNPKVHVMPSDYVPIPHFKLKYGFRDVAMRPAPVHNSRVCSPLGAW